MNSHFCFLGECSNYVQVLLASNPHNHPVLCDFDNDSQKVVAIETVVRELHKLLLT